MLAGPSSCDLGRFKLRNLKIQWFCVKEKKNVGRKEGCQANCGIATTERRNGRSGEERYNRMGCRIMYSWSMLFVKTPTATI